MQWVGKLKEGEKIMQVLERKNLKEYYNIVNGEVKKPKDGSMIDTYDPATGKAWARIPTSKKEDVEEAIQAARTAFPNWSNLPARMRGDYLRQIGDMIPQYGDELLELETKNNGWVLDEHKYLVEVLRQMWYDAAGAAALLGGQGRTVQMGSGNFGFTLRKPYGVVVGILPWNAPLFTFTIKAAYALAAGNTVVIKPSEEAAVGSLRYGELLANILPPGVINVISGTGEEIGDYLVGHKEVNKVSLTGSKATAELITRATSHMPKPLIFELGGKSPNIVFEDADLDQAVYGIIAGIFTRNAGQICVAGSRILIQSSIYSEVVERVKQFMTSEEFVKLGDTLNPNNTMGPIANARQFKQVCSFIDIAEEDGGKILFGGKYGGEKVLPNEPELKDGYWVEPTLVEVNDNHHKLAREEIFGPVAVAIPFDTEEEAIKIANDTNYGLAAGVWTKDLSRAHRLVDQLEAGNVWVNTYALVGVDLPFGGIKESGYGTDSILEYTYEKACVINIG